MHKPLRLILPLEYLDDLSFKLESQYPFINRCCGGISAFLEEALGVYHPGITEDSIGEFVEAFVDRLDFKIAKLQEELNTNELDNSAQEEIYSFEFYLFLLEAFKLIMSSFKDVVMNDPIKVVEHSFNYHGNLTVSILVEIKKNHLL